MKDLRRNLRVKDLFLTPSELDYRTCVEQEEDDFLRGKIPDFFPDLSEDDE